MFARFISSFLHILFVLDHWGISRGLDCLGGVTGVSVWYGIFNSLGWDGAGQVWLGLSTPGVPRLAMDWWANRLVRSSAIKPLDRVYK